MKSGELTDSSDPLSDNSISICELGDKPTSESKSSDKIYHCLLNDFYGFEHNYTKWILTSISSNIGLKRLQMCKTSKYKMFCSYFEIPDNPDQYNILKKELMPVNTPAFHPLASLYLNPLGISIYIRNEAALKTILDMKVNKFSDPCFIQKWWSKGEDKYLTDFSTINILALALRRNFMEGISIMMSADFNPNERFYHVEHIQSSDSSKTHVYQDGLDLAINLLHEKPGLDIARYFKIIANKNMTNNFHVISYEMNTILQCQNSITFEKIRLSSLFRIILKRATQIYNYKFASKYLSILEIMQTKGFFRYLYAELKSMKNDRALLSENHNKFCEEIFYPGDEIESQRLYQSDIEKLPYDKRIGCLLLDRSIIFGHLIMWLVDTARRERHNLKNKIAKLILSIFIDSNLVIWFLQTSDNIISDIISLPCCKVGPIHSEDVSLSKRIMIDVVQQSNILKTKLFTKINKLSSILYPLGIKQPFTKRQHNNKKYRIKPDYIMCDSHTIQSWNQPLKNNEVKLLRQYKSEEIPILSLKHKFERVNHSSRKTHVNKPTENEEPKKEKLIRKNSVSETNSLDSVAEITVSKQDLMAKYLPPPLVISRQKALHISSMKMNTSDYSSGDNINRISQTSLNDDDSTLVENKVAEK